MAAATSETGRSIQDLPPSEEGSQTPEQEPSTTGEEDDHNEQELGEDRQDNEHEAAAGGASSAPSQDEDAPPLPDEPLPGQADDGWDPIWDENAQAYYFYNRLTGVSQWNNPRVPDIQPEQGSGDDLVDNTEDKPRARAVGGYDPAIHGDYDPTAWYAQPQQQDTATSALSTDPSILYTATGSFNRFTGKWQPAGITPEKFSDENKSRRQLNAYFDVDAAANSHDGKSLKAERSGKKLTKKELKAFKEKRRERKEEKRRAWLRD